MQLYETRQYHPVASIAGALPVTFEVSLTFVQIEFRQPSVRMRVPLEDLRFSDDTFGLERLPVVTLNAGNESLWWETKLNAQDGAELKALVEEWRAQ